MLVLAVWKKICQANLMTYLENGTSGELFIGTDPLRVAQELQLSIAEAPRDNTRTVAQDAIDVLGDVRALYGSTKLAMRAMSAYVINRKLTIDEQVFGSIQFSDITIKGFFGGFQYVETNWLRSLCLDLYRVTVLNPVEPDDPDDGKLSMPLIVPVHSVECVWPMN